MSRDCYSCSNFIGPNSDASLFPGDLGACRARGEVITRVNASEEANQASVDKMSKDCPKYNQYPKKDILIPIIGMNARPFESNKSRVAASTCRACIHSVPPAKTSEAYGIRSTVCGKLGGVIPDTMSNEIAKGCNESERVAISDANTAWTHNIANLVLKPHLKELFDTNLVAGASVADLADVLDSTIDPATYPSDKPVSQAAKNQGVRAWRRITSGEREVWLPIFDPSIFTDAERSKIPAYGDDEHPETYVDHMNLAYAVSVLWFHLKETPALNGKAGTGKTEFFRWMAYLMQLPFERISITRSTELEDLAGKMHFEDNQTVFKPGRIPRAWAKPCVLVLDEPNTGPPEVWQYIRPLTDSSKQLANDLNEGEIISRHPFSFLGMAMNPAWDSRNVGAEQIGDADGSRLMHIYVDMPTREVEEGIIRQRCELDGYSIPDDTLAVIMTIAERLREMSDNQELPLTWGIRNQIKVARVTAWFDLHRAYSMAVLDYLEPELRETVLEVVRDSVKEARR